MKIRFYPIVCSLMLLLLVVFPVKTYSQILAWQLNGSSGNETSINAATNDAGLYISSLQRGAGLSASGLANAFSSSSFTASGNKADAIANSRFIYFTIQAQPGYRVSLTTLNARFRRSSTGPNTFRWQYSLDGLVFFDLGTSDISYSGTETNGLDQAAVDLSGASTLQNVPSGTTITIRLLGWGATGTTGTFAIGRSTTTNATDFSISLDGTVSTALSPPVATPATSISHNAFNANWDPVAGATGYRLDVSTSPLFTAFQNLTATEEFDGGTTPPTDWTFTGIGGTYTSSGNYGMASPSLQMDATNDRVVTKEYNGIATQLSFWIKGQGPDASSALLVEGYDGSSWITIHNITNTIPTTGTIFTYNSFSSPALPGNLNRFRFTYTKSTGNLAFDDVIVTYDEAVPSFVAGYENLVVSGISKSVNGIALCQNSYYYRVRSEDGTFISDNSNIITVGQIPQQRYRSVVTGLWNDPATWEIFNGTAWVAATTFPNSASTDCPDDDVVIRSGHVVTFTGSYAFPEVEIEDGGELVLTAGSVLNVTEIILVNGVLKMIGDAVVSGAGDFTLLPAAQLFVGSPDGIAVSGAGGNIRVTGTRTYSAGASYTYTGLANQATGTGLTQNIPLHVTFDSPGNTVTLSAALTVTGNLSILAGTLDADNRDISVGGNWTNTGTFLPGTASVDFFGAGVGNIGATNFNRVVFSGAGTKTAAGDLVISGDLIINDNFNAGAFVHTVGGNWINNGVFTASTSVIKFNNVADDQTISGSANAGNNTFYSLEVDKGTQDKILEVTSPIGLTATANNSLIITSGTFRLTDASTIYPFNNGTHATIPATGGLWNNGGIISAGNFSWNLGGLLKVTDGIVNIGVNDGNSLRYSTGSVVYIEGGELNVAGRISWSAFPGPESVTYIQSGGTVRLVTSGSASTTLAALDIAAPGSVFTMSGGAIIFQRATSNMVECLNLAAIHTVTGGLFQFGDDQTPPGEIFRINSTVPVWDLVINDHNNPVMGVSVNNLVVLNDVTIGGILDADVLDISVGGDWINNGTFIPGTGTVTFEGTAMQTIGGAVESSFYGLAVNNSAGVFLGNNQNVSNLLNLDDGVVVTGANVLSVGSSGTVTGGSATAHVSGKLARVFNSAVQKSFPVGKDGNYMPAAIEYTALTGISTVVVEVFSNGFPGTPPTGVAQVGTRYWDISESGGASITCNITLDGGGLSFAGGSVIMKYDAPNTAVYQTTLPDYTVVGLNGFSSFAFGNCTRPTFTYTTSDISCFNGSDGTITINASGGSGGGYEYRIHNGTAWIGWQSGNTFTGLPVGDYTLEIRDGNGCVQVDCD